MSFEGLTRQNLGEQIRRVGLARNMADHHLASAAKLAHLEELTIHVARVLRGSEPMAEVVCGLAVGARLDGLANLVPEELDKAEHVQQLDGQLAQCHELCLT